MRRDKPRLWQHRHTSGDVYANRRSAQAEKHAEARAADRHAGAIPRHQRLSLGQPVALHRRNDDLHVHLQAAGERSRRHDLFYTYGPDGPPSGTMTAKAKADQTTVTTTQKVDYDQGTIFADESPWIQVQTTKPNSVTSSKANFGFTCIS